MKKSQEKTRLNSPLKRGLLLVSVFVVAIIAGLMIYINLKKNDISKELLQLVNNEIKGDFTVQSVSLGSLFSYPNLNVTIKGLEFRAPNVLPTHGEIVLSVPSIILHTDLSDVFSKQVIIEKLNIDKARLYIERDSFATSIIAEAFQPISSINSKPDSTSLSIFVKELIIVDSKVIIKDDPAKVVLPFLIEQAKGNFVLQKNIIKGSLGIDLSPFNFEELEDLMINIIPIRIMTTYKVDLDRDKVVIDTKNLVLGKEVYAMKYDYNFSDQPSMKLDLNSTKTGVNFDSLFVEEIDTVEHKESIGLKGTGRFESKASWNPDAEQPFLEALEASFKLEGKDLKINGIDLDDIIDKYKRSQNFNLVDIGAVMFTGPAGLAVTKGGDFARLAFIKAGDSTHVKHFIAQWKMGKGLLKIEDLALSTNNNLIATEGWYQVQTDSLDFNFNVLDRRGCELVGQRIYGDATKPDYEKVNVLKTFMGPVKNFFRNIGMAKCDTIYRGKVKHPEL